MPSGKLLKSDWLAQKYFVIPFVELKTFFIAFHSDESRVRLSQLTLMVWGGHNVPALSEGYFSMNKRSGMEVQKFLTFQFFLDDLEGVGTYLTGYG